MLRAPGKRPVILRPIHPNAGIEAYYRKQLETLIQQMHRSYVYWLRAAWRQAPPKLAQDASTVDVLKKAFRKLGLYWEARFTEASEELTRRFADKSVMHTDAAMVAALKDAGFTVDFRFTRNLREAVNAVIQENVGLIKSIPAEFLQKVEGDVWRAVSSGYDLETMTRALHDRYGSTWKRAALIARDQTNKAKAAIETRRRLDLGIKEAIWQHSNAGKEPRPEHVKWGREKLRFDVAQGVWSEVDQAWVWPGTPINCRCTSRAVIPGFE